MSTTEFGQVDLITTTINMLLPVVAFSIADAVFRFVMDKNGDKVAVFYQWHVLHRINDINDWTGIPNFNNVECQLCQVYFNLFMCRFDSELDAKFLFAVSAIQNYLQLMGC